MLFDSNIVIDLLNGVPTAGPLILGTAPRSVSIVTVIEVLAGAPAPAEEAIAREVLSLFDVLPLDQPVAEGAAILRRTTRLKLPDAVILATARHHGLALVTRNTKDFAPGEPGIVIPYTL